MTSEPFSINGKTLACILLGGPIPYFEIDRSSSTFRPS